MPRSGRDPFSLFFRLLLAVLLLLPGCALQQSLVPEPSNYFARECTPPPGHILPPPAAPPPPLEGSEKDQPERFSPRFHRIVSVVGILPLLRKSIALERDVAAKKPGAELELIRVRQQILARTVLVTLEATSLAALVRCEQARADELADSLAQTEARSAQVATVVALIIESATMIATGALVLAGHSVAEGAVALGGGTMASILAGLSLYQPSRHEFQHPRNFLREIWENPPQAQNFPGPVWQFLTDPTDDGISLREQLVSGWMDLSRIKGQNEKERQERFNLLFGTGGNYTVADLRARGAMLEMLAAAIDLMHDELEVLVRELLVRDEAK